MTQILDPQTQDADRLNWDDLVEEGIFARRVRDGAQWTLGDLAREVETSYGGGELERYAEDIGVEYDTLREYRTLATTYGIADRSAHLSWTHHQRIASHPDRLDWLAEAAEKGWSVRKMLAEIEAYDEHERAELERARNFQALYADNLDLASAVASDEMSIQDALAEAAVRHARAERERLDYEGRIRRAKGRLETFLGGWLEFETFRTNPDREAILASLIEHDRARVFELEQQVWGSSDA